MATTLLLLVGVLVAARALVPSSARPVAPTSVPPGRRSRGRRRRRRRSDLLDLHWAEAIELIVLAVRAGHLPVAAIRTVHHHMHDDIGMAFDAVLRRCDRGERFADALDELPRLLGTRAHAVADGLAAADRDGLPLAPVLDRLADEARVRRRRRADAAARQLPVRLAVPLVLCTLPSFVLLAVAPLLLAALTSLRR